MLERKHIEKQNMKIVKTELKNVYIKM